MGVRKSRSFLSEYTGMQVCYVSLLLTPGSAIFPFVSQLAGRGRAAAPGLEGVHPYRSCQSADIFLISKDAVIVSL